MTMHADMVRRFKMFWSNVARVGAASGVPDATLDAIKAGILAAVDEDGRFVK